MSGYLLISRNFVITKVIISFEKIVYISILKCYYFLGIYGLVITLNAMIFLTLCCVINLSLISISWQHEVSHLLWILTFYDKPQTFSYQLGSACRSSWKGCARTMTSLMRVRY